VFGTAKNLFMVLIREVPRQLMNPAQVELPDAATVADSAADAAADAATVTDAAPDAAPVPAPLTPLPLASSSRVVGAGGA
jgi:hypothetical protein